MMKTKSGFEEGKGGDSSCQLIDAIIKEQSDWRGETLARIRILIRQAGVGGIVVRCQVLECEPPSRLASSWSAGPIIDTQVIYRLEPDGGGTRVFFEHSGFDMSHPWGEQAFRWATSRVWLGENARAASRRGREPCAA